MKKKSFIIFLIFLSCIIVPAQLKALDISVGLTTWYSSWDFDTSGDDENMKFERALLYGPLLSLRFTDDLSLSSVFLYGTYDSKEPEDPGYGGGPSEIDRYDSDTSLNYSINRYFKVFAGAKFMGFSFPAETGDGTHRGYGPGAGVALTIPLARSLFLLANVSGLYLKTEHKQDGYTVDVEETGFNSTAAIAYYSADISTSFTLGYRVQYVKVDAQEESERMGDSNMLFQGLTFAAVYSFEI